MFSTIAKWVSVVALLVAAMFWRNAAHYQLLLAFIVCVAAIIIIQQALRANQYTWAVGFLLIAVLFNPVVPVIQFSGNLSLLVVLVCIAPFAVSLSALKHQRVLSIPSIINENPGSESL